MKIRLLLLLVFFIPMSLMAQSLKRFSNDKNQYLEELRNYLKQDKSVKEEEDLVPLLGGFSDIWLNEDFSPEESNVVVKISNNYLRKRITEFESWMHYLKIIEHFTLSEEPGALLPFLQDLEKLSNEPAKRSTLYLRTVYGTLYNSVIFDNGRIRWEVIGDVPAYTFDGEPIFNFGLSDLWGFYKNDSTVIEGTNIVFKPRTYTVEAGGGITYFTRAGLSQDSAYVELSSFTVNVNKGNFDADSAVLHSQYYLKQPVLGRYSEKLTSQSGAAESAVFPRFKSYRSDIVIPDMFPDAQFEGGFSVVGAKFYGSGDDSTKAKLKFNYQDTLLIRITAERFQIRSDKVYSKEVEAVIYLKNDSIYHPRVTMRYLPERGKFTLLRDDDGMGAASFSDTYHNLDMKFEVLDWNIGSPTFSLGNLNLGAAEAPVVFESKDYFRERRFSSIQGLNNRNPLVHLRNLSKSHGGRQEFTADEVGRFMRMDKSNAHIFLMNMAILGFVDYNLDTREAVLKDKIFEYILNMQEKRDFDVIQFVSKVESGSNAVLSLENFDMKIEGIEAIALSDSQKVGLFPYNEQIVMKKGLDFEFDGKIGAGRFTYWGNDFKFIYDAFTINMLDIDSMRFKVESFEPNALGQRELVNVKTVLQDLKGELVIDKADNKSSKEEYSEYPIFRSAQNSYIYYDRPSTYGGVYNREDFYVTLEPFEIDSLDNASTTGLFFNGTLTSAGIFPDLDEPIKVQEDYSLGFTRETPSEGLSAYGGKGKFTNTLKLSNKGLRGDGRIDYLNSFAVSDEFVFFPDSTNGIAQTYELDEKSGGAGSNPHVTNSNVKLHWEPYNDVLYTTSKQTPFAMYDEIGMQGKGTLAHSPNGLHGKGIMSFLNAETRSKDYTFESRRVLSPKSAFKVRANTNSDWGFGVENAKAEVDFNQQKGWFRLNDPAHYFSFTANEYIGYMDFAKWDIPEKSISVKKEGSTALSEMISVRPEQDSLMFMAERSKFYLTNSLLESFNVPNIDVADAIIYPDTGYVAIDTAAKMRTLKNASIIASIDNEYHSFYGATLNIHTRHKYNGNADYEYLDQDGTPWPIHFSTVRADTGVTIGIGNIEQDEAFYMSPYFAYYGNVRLRASRKELKFNGYTHIESSCPTVSTNWFRFESLIDPDNILIDLPEVDPDDKTKTLANGVFLDADTITGYAAFLSREVSPADKQMFFANGVLYYDEGNTSYVVTTLDRVKSSKAAANILMFNNVNCTMYGEGEMSLGGAANDPMTFESYGTINYDLETDEMQIETLLGLDFFFNEKVQERMAELITKYSEGSGIDMTSKSFTEATKFMLKEKDREKLMESIKNYGAPEELPKEMRPSILLGKTTMNWTQESISFLSEGKIGITSFGDHFVNMQVDGFFEIQRKRRGDEIYMLLEIDGSTDLYMEYKRGIMGIYSNDDELMNMLKEMDIKDRRKEEKGKLPFTYMVSTKGKMNRFIRRFDMFDE